MLVAVLVWSDHQPQTSRDGGSQGSKPVRLRCRGNIERTFFDMCPCAFWPFLQKVVTTPMAVEGHVHTYAYFNLCFSAVDRIIDAGFDEALSCNTHRNMQPSRRGIRVRFHCNQKLDCKTRKSSTTSSVRLCAGRADVVLGKPRGARP